VNEISPYEEPHVPFDHFPGEIIRIITETVLPFVAQFIPVERDTIEEPADHSDQTRVSVQLLKK
jgi:hypothetical protein